MHQILLNDKQLKSLGLFAGEGFWVLERIPAELINTVFAVGSFYEQITNLGIDKQKIQLCSKEKLNTIAGFKFHRGVITIARRPVISELPDDLSGTDRYLILVDIADPDNLGSLLRSASAFGVDNVVVTPGTADIFSRKALRCSMAQVFRMKIYSISSPDSLNRFHDCGIPVIAAAVGEGCIPISEKEGSIGTESWGLMMGNEGWGLSEKWLQMANIRITIPMMPEVDSLNVGVAGGILLFSLTK